MRTYGEIFREVATYGSITAAAGTLAAVEGNNRSNSNAKLRAEAKDLKDQAHAQVESATSKPFPDRNSPEVVAAKTVVLANQGKIGTMRPCNEYYARSDDPELSGACAFLEQFQFQDNLYRQRIAQMGVHPIEAQMTNQYFNDALYYGGGSATVVSLLLIGSMVAARWLNARSPIQFVR